MNASSSDAFCGLSSCSTTRYQAASSPMRAASTPSTSIAPSSLEDGHDAGVDEDVPHPLRLGRADAYVRA